MLTAADKKQLDDQGILLLPDIITRAEADALRQLSLSLAQRERQAERGFTYLDHAQRVWNLVDKDPAFEQAIQHPRILEPMEYLLGEDLTLSSFTINTLGPGTPDGHLHVDVPLTRLPAPRPSFPLVANSVWFLDDFTRENGATCCVPGSHHRLDVLPDSEKTYDDKVQITGPKGSVLILNGAVWHGSSANRTESERVGLLGFFCRSFLKPQQNHLELVSEEVVARATPKLKQLLGYDSMPSTLT